MKDPANAVPTPGQRPTNALAQRSPPTPGALRAPPWRSGARAIFDIWTARANASYIEPVICEA